MADDLTPEQRTAIGQRLLEGRKRAAEAKAEHPMIKLDDPTGIVAPTANGHPHLLDIADPAKWQMKVRVFFQTLDAPGADKWLEGLDLIRTMAMRLERDQIYKRVTTRCFVCDIPLKDGRPAGTQGYYAKDGTYIQVHCHDQREYPELLKMIMVKEQTIAAAEERTAKAVRQALMDVRSKVERDDS